MPDAEKSTETPEPAARKPWGDDFDEERAWTLIQNLRAEKSALKRERDDARAAQKDAEKARDDAMSDAETAKKDLAADRRASILREFDIDEDDAEEFLSGDLSLDELRRKAERLSRRGGEKKEPSEGEPKSEEPQEGDSDAGETPKGDNPAAGLHTRPRPRYSPASGGEPAPELDIDAIARDARRR